MKNEIGPNYDVQKTWQIPVHPYPARRRLFLPTPAEGAMEWAP